MSRDIHADFNAQAKAEHIGVMAYAFEGDFSSGFVRINSTDRDIDFDSGSGVQTFSGVGQLGKISNVQESSELQAAAVAVGLTGIPGAHISIALDEDYQGRAGKLWLVILDPTTYHPVQVPLLIFSGLMDTMDIQAGEEAEVVVHIQNRFADWNRPRVRRYTNADQQAEFSGDEGFEFISQTVEKEVFWGPISSGGGGGSAGSGGGSSGGGGTPGTPGFVGPGSGFTGPNIGPR